MNAECCSEDMNAIGEPREGAATLFISRARTQGATDSGRFRIVHFRGFQLHGGFDIPFAREEVW